MRRATVNFWIDAVIAVAFLLSAASGILFLLPTDWRSASAAGGAAIFGMSVAGLHAVHDWSGVIAAAGVVVHSALHVRWFLNMARRLWRGEERAPRAAPASPPAASATRTPVTGALSPAASASVASVVGPTSVDDARLSRRTFLAGLGTAAGALAFLGVASALRDGAADAAGTRLANAPDDWSDPSQAQNDNGWQWGGQGNGWQGDGQSPSDGAGSSGMADGQRVVVDSASCVGCGRCPQVCPYGVFAWNGDGTVVAQDPQACRLCGHCVGVCPANAITLNA